MKFNEETLLEELKDIAAENYSQEELADIFDISLGKINHEFTINKSSMSNKRALVLKDIAIRKKLHQKAMNGDVPTLIYIAMTRLGMTNI